MGVLRGKAFPSSAGEDEVPIAECRRTGLSQVDEAAPSEHLVRQASVLVQRLVDSPQTSRLVKVEKGRLSLGRACSTLSIASSLTLHTL